MKILIIFGFAFCLCFYALQSGPSLPIQPIQIPIESKKLSTVDAAQVLVVNMIPREQSGEHGQDSEPFLAVNTSEKLMIAAAYSGETRAGRIPPPLFSSLDGGENWKTISIIPARQIFGQTYCFSGNQTSFFGSIDVGTDVSVFHVDDPRSGKPLQNISTLSSGGQFADQPFVQARSFVLNLSESQKPSTVERIYVGQNYFGSELGDKTASVRVSVDSGKTFRLLGIEARDTGSAGQDGPEVRPALASDDTVYVAFLHWKSKSGERFAGDVIVVRDDEAAAGKTPFQSLIEPEDAMPGRIVAKNREFSLNAYLGKQRVGTGLSLVVDPRESGTVYVAWVDYDRVAKTSVVHVRRSTDKGQNWSEDLHKIESATNPAIAVSTQGVVGLLYQQLKDPRSPQERWETHFRASEDGTTGWTDIELSSFPTASEPARDFDPYLGDKVHLLSVDENFHGVFSAPNTPEQKYFPQGVKFQRNYAGGKLLSKDSKEVPVSIDPYYFRVTGKRALNPAASPAYNDKDISAAVVVWSKPFWLGLVLVVLILGVAATALVQAYRAPQKLLEQSRGPTLTNYTGFVTAEFIDSEGRSVDQLSAGSSCQLTVKFAQEPPSEEWFGRIALTGGKDASTVDFRIAIDTSEFDLDHDRQDVRVPASGSEKVTFTVTARPEEPDELDEDEEVRAPKDPNRKLFIQIYQKTRLVQVIATKLYVLEQNQQSSVG